MRIVIFLLVLFIFNCESLSKSGWEAVDVKDDFILFKKPKPIQGSQEEPYDRESLRLIFSNLYTKTRLFSDKRYLLNSTFIKYFINLISFQDPKNNDFLLVYKKPDNVFPATRMERIVFYFGYRDNHLFIDWQEVDRPLLFLAPYTDRDWQNLEQFEIPCQDTQKLWLEDEIGFTASFSKDENCPSSSTQKENYNKMIIKTGNKVPVMEGRSIEDRLKELDEIYKKKLISKEEYQSLRKKILNEL